MNNPSAIARVNRPYENESQQMVKPHGFVLDFVGIFDKLEKALAFDSEEINAIVKDIKLLKNLFQTKIEAQSVKYLPLIQHNFNTQETLDLLINQIQENEQRKREQAERGFDSLTYFVYQTLEAAEVSNPPAVSKDIKQAFINYPNWQTSE